MSAWRREAHKSLPEFQSLIQNSEGPMALWIELDLQFEKAFNCSNENLIRRILQYASWSVSEKSGKLPTEASTAVVCAFYESLPRREKYWSFFPKWFYPNEFSKILHFFAYSVSPEKINEIKLVFEKR